MAPVAKPILPVAAPAPAKVTKGDSAPCDAPPATPKPGR